MKKILLPSLIGLASVILLTGCVAIAPNAITTKQEPTVGQQLIDLQKAKDSGAINDAEFQAEKDKILHPK